MNAEKDRYCVVGNPIAQSKSPQIHAIFAQQTGLDIDYQKHLVELDGFNAFAEPFFASKARGMNITAPFKEDAFRFAHTLTERARLAEAVNTLIPQLDGSLLGDNTDGKGIVWDICDRLGWALKGKRVLVLGAGGAVKGVLYMLLKQQPEEVIIANRTVAKAQALAERFSEYGNIRALPFDVLDESFGIDVVINGTSASLGGALPGINERVFCEHSKVYDMVYGKTLSPFLSWAQSSGAGAVSDGLGMLVGQAAESFELWTQKRPDIQAAFDECISNL